MSAILWVIGVVSCLRFLVGVFARPRPIDVVGFQTGQTLDLAVAAICFAALHVGPAS